MMVKAIPLRCHSLYGENCRLYYVKHLRERKRCFGEKE
jgi:hypothetical protein